MNSIQRQSNITCVQRGAGTGKTYEICSLINALDDKTNIIYLSKTHSAVFNIFDQITQLYTQSKLNIDIQQTKIDDFTKNGKQYVLKYKTKAECKFTRSIVIGTIDSFFYSFKPADFEHKTDFFSELAQYISQQTTINGFTYKQITVNHQSIIIVDEVQDLPVVYGEALKTIHSLLNVDLYMVGDYLQSIYFEKNAMQVFNINNGSNNVIRFSDCGLKNFVNNIVNFSQFKNRQVVEIQNVIDKQAQTDCLQIKQQWKMRSRDIVEIFTREFETYPNPADYMIITPFVQRNYWLDDLRVQLEEFWQKKYPNNKQKFVEFHKSQENRPIDLKSSHDKTRIQSIHSSKGTGRNVVIVVDLSEANLLKFTDQTQNISYESLIYVALTRQKNKLYVFFQNDYDDIGVRMLSNHIVQPALEQKYQIDRITNFIQMQKFVRWLVSKSQQQHDTEFLDTIGKIFDENNIQCRDNQASQIIDYNHFIIRHQILLFQFQLKLVQNWEQFVSEFITTIEIHQLQPEYYWQHMNTLFASRDKQRNKQSVYLLRFKDNNNQSDKYYNEACNFVMKNIKKMKETKQVKCFIQVFIFQYLYNQVFGIPRDQPILDLYDTIIWYLQSVNQFKHISNHQYCLCLKMPNSNIYDPQSNKLAHFYSKLEQVDDMVQQYKQIVSEMPDKQKQNYLQIGQFILHETYPLQTQDTVTLFVQQLNLLNQKEIILKSAVSQLFGGGEIKRTIIISFDQDVQVVRVNSESIRSLQDELKKFLTEQCLIYNQQIMCYIRHCSKTKMIQQVIEGGIHGQIPDYIRQQVNIYYQTGSLEDLSTGLNAEVQNLFGSQLQQQ